jgi:ribose transport system substrate-binding protein
MLTKYPKEGDRLGLLGRSDGRRHSGGRRLGPQGHPNLWRRRQPGLRGRATEPKSPASAVAAQQPYYGIGKTVVQNVAKYLAGQKVHLSPSFRTC